MLPLNAHQHQLLVELCRRKSIPKSEFDGRHLRALLSRNLASEGGGIVRPTSEGIALSRFQPSDTIRAPTNSTSTATRLSDTQEALLRYLLQQDGHVPTDHLDGRSLRALERQDLISVQNGWAAPTLRARSHFEAHVHQQRRIMHRRIQSGRASARAGAVLRAADELERAIPRGSELMLGDVPAYADDVLAGLRRFAREMDSRGPVQGSE
jgi:hypothetical protein